MNENNSLFILPEGTMLADQYRIESVLGAGGFGITYKAWDTKLAFHVAVKEFFPRSWVTRNVEVSPVVAYLSNSDGLLFTSLKGNFIKEAQVMASLRSADKVVGVLNYFDANNTAYIVMEFLNGVTLKNYVIQKAPMDPVELSRLVLPLLKSLSMIHQRKILHRDIAPDNIMLMHDTWGYPFLKLMDFGAARSFAEPGSQTKSVILKPGFAPIEQYQKAANQGAPTDLYALCATMYYCITGVIPDSATERITYDTLCRPSTLGVSISDELEDVILKGMSIKPEDRYQNASEMEEALKASLPAVSKEITFQPPTPDSPKKPFGNKYDGPDVKTLIIVDETEREIADPGRTELIEEADGSSVSQASTAFYSSAIFSSPAEASEHSSVQPPVQQSQVHSQVSTASRPVRPSVGPTSWPGDSPTVQSAAVPAVQPAVHFPPASKPSKKFDAVAMLTNVLGFLQHIVSTLVPRCAQQVTVKPEDLWNLSPASPEKAEKPDKSENSARNEKAKKPAAFPQAKRTHQVKSTPPKVISPNDNWGLAGFTPDTDNNPWNLPV